MATRRDGIADKAQIEVRGAASDAALRRRAMAAMTAVLARLTVRPIVAHVTFVDENGPKGGRAARCALTVRLPFRPSVRVEELAETPRLAFDAAVVVLQRDLKRHRERQRDQQRRPKKYFVAKRILGGEPGVAGTAGPPKSATAAAEAAPSSPRSRRSRRRT